MFAFWKFTNQTHLSVRVDQLRRYIGNGWANGANTVNGGAQFVAFF